MKQPSRLAQGQRQTEQQAEAQSAQQQSAQEFASADEMLRFDAAQTKVPPEIEQRLKQSAASIPQPPPRSWWRNMFGK